MYLPPSFMEAHLLTGFDAATTTSTSALGTTSSIDASQVGKSALGTGLSQGAQTMSYFYLDLVKQTTPIIEVGAARKITVIIAEGNELFMTRYVFVEIEAVRWVLTDLGEE